MIPPYLTPILIITSLFLSLLYNNTTPVILTLTLLPILNLLFKLFTPPGYVQISQNDIKWSWNGPKNPFVINGLQILDRCTLQNLQSLYVALHRFPKLKKVIKFWFGIPCWVDDPHFSLEKHIILAPIGQGPSEATKEEVATFIGDISGQPLPPDRPLWQIYLVEKYEGGRSLVLTRLHHVIADGIGLMGFIFDILEKPENKELGLEIGKRDGGSQVGPVGMELKGWGRVVKLGIEGLWVGFIKILKLGIEGPWVGFKKSVLLSWDGKPLGGTSLSGKRKVAWSDPLPLENIKAIKNFYHCTVNDILSTCVTRAFHQYLLKTNNGNVSFLKNRTVKAVIPINMRNKNEMEKVGLFNKFSTAILDLPIQEEEPLARLHETQKRMNKIKQSPEAIVIWLFTNIFLKLFPLKLLDSLMNAIASKCTMVFTNVPGPTYKLKMGNVTLHELLAWVPCGGDMAWGISVISYGGSVQMGVIVDVAVSENPQLVVDEFVEGYKELLESIKR